VKPTIIDPIIFIFWYGINLFAIWLLYKNEKIETSPLKKRHYIYIISGFLVVTFSILKALVTLGIDVAFLLPLGMLLNDIFVSIIGLAIIKEKLFDITVVFKKGTLYSILAGILIFVYSFVEHFLVTFIGERVGENSTFIHLIAVAIGIAVLMPIKNRIEKGVEGYFAQRKLEF
jgi:CDP-diglyceride synthetase